MIGRAAVAAMVIGCEVLRAANAYGQRDAAPPRPTVGELSPGRALAAEHTVLPNGVRLTTLPYGRTPKALVRVVIETGAEPVAQCRMTAVLTEALQSGDAALTGVRLADSIAHMGGALTAVAQPERIELSLEVLSPYAAAAVEMLGRMVRDPRLDSATARAAEQAVARLGPRDHSDVNAVARDAFETALFPGGEFNSPCATPADIERYTPDDLRGFYDAHVRTRHTAVYVVGRFDRVAVERAVAQVLGGWRHDGVEAKAVAMARDSAPALTIIQSPGAKQAAIVVGARVPGPTDSDYVPLGVANAMLGGSLISRITLNIREAKGYAYGPTSDLTAAPSGAAYWAEVTNVAANVGWPALREIIKEIQRLGTEAPSEAELTDIKRYVVGKVMVDQATRGGRLNALEAQDVAATGAEPRAGRGDDAMRRMVAVTPAEIQRVVGTHLHPRRLTIVVAADTTLMADQMAELRRGLATSD